MNKCLNDGILNHILSEMLIPDISRCHGVSHPLETLHQSSIGLSVTCLCCLDKVREFFHSPSSKIFYDRGSTTGPKSYLETFSILPSHTKEPSAHLLSRETTPPLQ